MKKWAFISCILYFSCTGNLKEKTGKDNYQLITDRDVQDSLFNRLNNITAFDPSATSREDSLSFLILPVRVSCAACRKKAIKEIVKNKNNLDNKHFVIITGEGLRSINSYFTELNLNLPYTKNIFYDTLETALQANLISTNPNIYFSYNRKVYKKVTCIPRTIKNDLDSFFNIK